MWPLHRCSRRTDSLVSIDLKAIFAKHAIGTDRARARKALLRERDIHMPGVRMRGSQVVLIAKPGVYGDFDNEVIWDPCAAHSGAQGLERRPQEAVIRRL